MHLPQLIIDLGHILGTAALVGILFKYLKQPMILGFLLAGFLLGPHIGLTPTVKDTVNIKIWAEIGVIFLLFSIGLEFSIKKLKSIGSRALTTGLVEVHVMLGLGFLSGKMLGWSNVESLFLGSIMSISSTAIAIKSFEEFNIKNREFAPLVIGVLIVEDVFTVLLMVALPTLSITNSLSGIELLSSISKLIFFVALCFVIGIFILPIFLKKIRHILTDELTFILCLGLCLLLVFISNESGYSSALGALVMGSILADTKEGKKAVIMIRPVKELFAAVFFVSVGMLIDPKYIFQNWGIVLIVSTLTFFGKFFANFFGALLSGSRFETALGTGISLAQVGEFSFIIASLGVSLDLINPEFYSLTVAVSLITAFMSPNLLKNFDSFYIFADKCVPQKLRETMKDYRFAVKWESNDQSTMSILFDAYAWKVFFNSVIIVALNLTFKKTLLPYLRNVVGYETWVTVLVAGIFLISASPFIWAITRSQASKKVTADVELNKRVENLKFGTNIIRLTYALGLLIFLNSQFSSLSKSDGIIVSFLTLFVTLLCHFSAPIYHRFEEQFYSNIDNQEEI